MTWVWTFTLVILDLIDPESTLRGDYYGLLILQQWFFPLQGLFNLLVFVRPDYLQQRGLGASRWQALYAVLFQNTTDRSNSNRSSRSFRGRNNDNNNTSSTVSSSLQQLAVRSSQHVASGGGVADTCAEVVNHPKMPLPLHAPQQI